MGAVINDRKHVFISYSHRDRRWLDRLKIHLRPLERDLELQVWDDSRLTPGLPWRDEIRKAIEGANAAVLLVSADFLASDFIHTDELPPLLRAAKEEGALILPIIISPSLFLRTPPLSQFQAVNDPARPLVSISEGEQEDVFLRVADQLFQQAPLPIFGQRTTLVQSTQTHLQSSTPSQTVRSEAFLEHKTWARLVKIGDWIFDEERRRITGSGIQTYLVSRNEYGDRPFQIEASLEFSNFSPPSGDKLGMNAGIIFGWLSEAKANRYYNVLITGSELLVERIGFHGGSEGQDYEHCTRPVSLPIQRALSYRFRITVNAKAVEIAVGGKIIQTLPRPTGVKGRVGLRPWRSQLDCTDFVVHEDVNP